MKKALKIICSIVAAIFVVQLALVTAEAANKKPRQRKKPKTERSTPARFARVAILPVINLQEDIDYANSIVFQKALEVFKYPDYEIYDSDRFYKALEEVDYYEKGKTEVTEEMLRTIMQKSGLDMIVMVKLEELTQGVADFGAEDAQQLKLKMHIMAIYDWQDKIVNLHIKEEPKAPYAVVMKRDWKLEEFSRTVSIQLERIAKRGIK